MDADKEKQAELAAEMQALKEQMQARRNRPLAEALTIELLQSTPDDEIEQLIIDYISGKRRKAKQEAAGKFDLREFARQLSPGLRMVYATISAQGEIDNGGFHQFFYNSTGRLAEQAIEGFELLGAPAYAELMRRAVVCLKEESEMQLRIRKERNLETFFASYKETKLGDLDKEFYALGKSNPLEEMRVRYIRAHLSEFVTH